MYIIYMITRLRCTCVTVQHAQCDSVAIQSTEWNSSKPDTIGTRVFFSIIEVSISQGFTCIHTI